MKKAFIPKHPHLTRSEVVDEEIVEAGTYEDCPLDSELLVPYHSFTDDIKSGKEPAKIGSLDSVTNLQAARAAALFVRAFNAAGMKPSDVFDNSPAASAAPAAPAAPVEPSNPQ